MRPEKSLLLKNCKVYIDGHLLKRDILSIDGKIKKIDRDIGKGEYRIIDCRGNIVLPGLVDTHVHMRDPGLIHKEDLRTGSIAAAAGGVTTIIDMPNTIPQTVTAKNLQDKLKIAQVKSVVNYGFHIGATKNNFQEIIDSKDSVSTKIFMNESTGDMKMGDDLALEMSFHASRMVIVHAEGDTIKKAVSIAKKTKRRLHLAHISEKKEIEWLKDHKVKGVTIEVTPHHLYLTRKDEPLLHVKPSLKTKKDVSALWKAIRSGLVDSIGSDHAPHLLKEKKEKICYGLPGVETTLPLMLDAVNKKKLSLKRLVELCCENPCEIFGIKNKGRINEGYDSDFVIVDIKKEKKVGKIFSKCAWSPYKGWKLKGWPIMTIVGGNVVYNRGKIHTEFLGTKIDFERA